MKILAVDDDPAIIELIPLILENAGFEDVVTASAALEALDFIVDEGEPFDCFLLDIQMPGIDGVELCALIRDMPAYKKAPIIMLTAMTDKAVVQKAFDAGATDYATKPFEIFELVSRVRGAERFVQEMKASIKQNGISDLVDADTTELDAVLAPVQIDGIKGILDVDAFGNYVKQLSQSGRGVARMFALQIGQIGQLHGSCSRSEFSFVLEEVSEALMDAQRHLGTLACYQGNGLFLCLSTAATMSAPEDIEAEIQTNIDERDLMYDAGTPLDIEIAVGAPVQLSQSSLERLDSLTRRATERMVRRWMEKRQHDGRPNIRPTLLKDVK